MATLKRNYTKGYNELFDAGYTNVVELGTREVIADYGVDSRGNITPKLHGPVKRGYWYTAVAPNRHVGIIGDIDTVLILRQSSHIWHAFFGYNGTASGSSVSTCTRGGLGDAITTDREMSRYCTLVRRAPVTWCDTWHGLSAAKSQCANDARYTT